MSRIENIYMTLDGENVVCKENNEVKITTSVFKY